MLLIIEYSTNGVRPRYLVKDLNWATKFENGPNGLEWYQRDSPDEPWQLTRVFESARIVSQHEVLEEAWKELDALNEVSEVLSE